MIFAYENLRVQYLPEFHKHLIFSGEIWQNCIFAMALWEAPRH